VVQWLCRQQRKSDPRKVHLTCHTLRHNRSFWLSVEQFQTNGRPACVEGVLKSGEELDIQSDNVRVLSVGPISGERDLSICLDGSRFEHVDISARPCFFQQKDGRWNQSDENPVAASEKRHGCSGPIGDVFFEPLVIVKGTTGTEHERFVMDWLAGHVPAYFKKTNGGVHRGVFDGESFYEIRVLADREVSDEVLESHNLILWGTAASNSVVESFGEACPVGLERNRLTLGERAFEGTDVGMAVCFPSPFNPERYAVLVGGVSPAALAASSHLNLQLLPDYLAWNGSQVLGFGFMDNSWTVGE